MFKKHWKMVNTAACHFIESLNQLRWLIRCLNFSHAFWLNPPFSEMFPVKPPVSAETPNEVTHRKSFLAVMYKPPFHGVPETFAEHFLQNHHLYSIKMLLTCNATDLTSDVVDYIKFSNDVIAVNNSSMVCLLTLPAFGQACKTPWEKKNM